jgi:hydroxymethylglutaryl-CoA reductase
VFDPELEAAIASRSSRLPGFYRLPWPERRAAVARWAGLSEDESALLDGGLTGSVANAMVENAVGTFGLPLGIATNFVVNGRDVLVPMAIEEPSVVAAASNAARMARSGGGFEAEADEPVMIGQVQVLDLPGGDPEAAAARVMAAAGEITALATAQNAVMAGLGGGARGVECRALPDSRVGPMLIVHILFDTRDAMGANTVNTACEAVAPLIASLTGGRVLLRILSNLADRRLARARCRVPASELARPGAPGEDVARRIVEANALALVDPYRAATHNKGIMNGIDPVAIATGNDWRGAEAGAHAFAARDGQYRALTDWRQDERGDLVGEIALPLALGTVGGSTGSHPAARVALKILSVSSARELAGIVASVGLAQNLAALRALTTEGIQAGHMALHARQAAVAEAASGAEAERIARGVATEG